MVEGGGNTWTLDRTDSTVASCGRYFHTENSPIGVSNCIIFRPDGISDYEGVYTVTIEGLKTYRGMDTALTYQVGFFNPSNLGPEAPGEEITYRVTVENGSGSGEYAPGEEVRATAKESVEGGGSISPSSTVYVEKGRDQTFRFAPGSRSCLDRVLIDGTEYEASAFSRDRDGIQYYTFERVETSHAITAVFADAGKEPEDNRPARPGVSGGSSGLIRPGIQPGAPARSADPAGSVDPEMPGQPFQDVPSGHWAAGQIAWAQEKGVLQGGDGNFNPGALVNRQQLVAMLFWFAVQRGYTAEGPTDVLNCYPNHGTAAGYVREALA